MPASIVLGFLCAVLPAAGGTAAQDVGSPAAPALKDIRIFFKLDPGPTYGGPRWVPAPSFSSEAAGRKDGAVEARARGVDAHGRMVEIVPKWTPGDPEMVIVTPSAGNEVKIVAQRAGESRLSVTSGGVSKELTIKAAYQDHVLQVTVSSR